MTYHSDDKITMILWRSIVVTLIMGIAIIAIMLFIAFEKSYECQKHDISEAYKEVCKNRSFK